MSGYTDLLDHGFTVSEAAEAMDLAVAEEIERRRVARSVMAFVGGGQRKGIGADGIVYKGWVIRRKWNVAKGYVEFMATNPDVPGVEMVASQEIKAKWAIDRQERVEAG